MLLFLQVTLFAIKDDLRRHLSVAYYAAARRTDTALPMDVGASL
jgi:hypothetical protein